MIIMVVFTKNILESLIFTEALRKNYHTGNISEAIILTETLSDKYKIADISETINLRELLRKSVTKTYDINEVLTLIEQAHPRVTVKNIFEILTLIEDLHKDIVGDQLTIEETLSYDVTKVVSDQLVIEEVLTTNLIKASPISEQLILTEGLTGYKI